MSLWLPCRLLSFFAEPFTFTVTSRHAAHAAACTITNQVNWGACFEGHTGHRQNIILCTCLQLGAGALHCPVACGLAFSSDWSTANSARAVAHCADCRAVTTAKAATCRSLGTASANCKHGWRHKHKADPHRISTCHPCGIHACSV
jgi:hypothetical protein